MATGRHAITTLSKAIYKINAGAVHSMKCTGRVISFYRYSAPTVSSFRSRIPFCAFPIADLQSIDIRDEKHNGFVTTFHFRNCNNSMNALTTQIRWPYSFSIGETSPDSEWRSETEAQIRKLIRIVGNAGMETSANELR